MMKKSIYKILFIIAIIVFLIFVIPLVLFIPAHIESNMSVNTEAQTTPACSKSNMSIDDEIPINEHHVRMISGLVIQFRDGITLSEIRAILENYSLPTDKLDYNFYGMPDKYYIIVDKDKIIDVEGELRKEENWTESIPAIEKGNYYVITVPEQATQDKNFIKMLDKYNLHVKTFVWCHVSFIDRPNSGISEERVNELKRELEKNENIFSVVFESIVE